MNPSPSPPSDPLVALISLVNPDLRSELEAWQQVRSLFPGNKPSEVVKTIRKLCPDPRMTPSGLIERLKSSVNHSTEGEVKEPTSEIVSDLQKLSVADLKLVAKGLNLPATAKANILEQVKQWLQEGGNYSATNPDEVIERRAKELAGELARELTLIDPAIAQRAILAAETAANDPILKKKGFERFAQLLTGVKFTGSKTETLKKIKDHINFLLVSRQQSSF